MIRKKSKKHQPEFDMVAAGKIFAKLQAKMEGTHITSPFHLYEVEMLRKRFGLTGKSLPTDVFVMGHGEPEQRDITKIGGSPFWPANKPWPKSKKGAPLFFLAQFNFSDSRDLFPKLPGDILLIFVESETSWAYEEDGFHFEWVSQNIDPMPRLKSDQIPYEINLFYGAIHRSADYLNPKYASDDYPKRDYLVPVFSAMKIGGMAGNIQGDSKIDPTFLCQLTSVQAAHAVEYPWLNRKEALTLDFNGDGIYGDANQLMIGDMGSLYFFMDKNGRVTCGMECY